MEKTYSPVMFRMAPIRFILCVLLVPFVIGAVVLFIWYLRCKAASLTIDGEKSCLRTGILSKRISEIWHKDVRQVKINQSLTQRIFGVGQISISSAAGDGDEIVLNGIVGPEDIKAVIDQARRSDR